MKSKTLLCILLLLIFYACETGNDSQQEKMKPGLELGDISLSEADKKKLLTEIKQLKGLEEQRKYLEKIAEDDQKFRGSEDAEVMLKYGRESQEYADYITKQIKQDNINLFKVEQYLNIHGHPSKEHGASAVSAPWIVIHHAPTYEARERNFETIYTAYLDGYLDDGDLSFYLGRMYQMKKGKRLKMESPYKMEDEINQLIEELDLNDKKERIQNMARPK